MKNTGLFMGGLLAGAIVGSVTALLFAPQKGTETRKQLMDKLHEMEHELGSMKDKIKEKGGEIKEELKKKIHNLEVKIENLLEEYKKTLEPTSGVN